MTFNKCSIKGRSYGEGEGDLVVGAGADRVDFSSNPMYERSFEFYDQSLLDEVSRGDPDAQEFFRLLSLCHTVMPEWTEDGTCLEYQAQSPDENALVSAARNFGFVFTKRTPRSITVTFNGQVCIKCNDRRCYFWLDSIRYKLSQYNPPSNQDKKFKFLEALGNQ